MSVDTRAVVVLVLCGMLMVTAGEEFSVDSSTITSGDFVVEGLAKVSEVPPRNLTLIGMDQNPKQTKGVAYYHEPVRMRDTGTKSVASFSTNFIFKQTPESYNGSSLDRRGDGMTFAMVEEITDDGGVAARLGLFPEKTPDYKLVAIEYDTYQNNEYEDPPEDHVGLDISSPMSVKTAEIDHLGFKFWTGDTIWSWIDYNGTTHNLEVRVANTSLRPANALLQVNYNLYNSCADEMFVGFTAGTGDAHSFYYITAWNFSSSGLPPKKSNPNTGLIIGVVAAVVVLLLLGLLGVFMFVRRRRRQAAAAKEDEDLLQMPGMPDYYSYKQLSVATKAFSENSKLGEGGFGNVYQGILPSTGSHVAVKRVRNDSKQGEREFLAEVSIISQLRHRNVVQLMGYCRDRGKYLLVYELLPHGSLDKALFLPKTPGDVLTWDVRMKILSGTAAALHYLHEGWRQQVIHRDVKSSNIMLDEEDNAKLGDFGLARLVDHSKNANTTLVAGTYGYIAPEASHTGKFTDKTDVFAFGAVALEIACGRKAFDGTAGDDFILVDMVWNRLGGGSLTSVVDRRLEGKFSMHELTMVLSIGLLCSHPDPKARPSMRQVVQVLAGDAPIPEVPATKPSMVFSNDFRMINFKDFQDTRSTMNDSGYSKATSSTQLDSSSLSQSTFQSMD